MTVFIYTIKRLLKSKTRFIILIFLSVLAIVPTVVVTNSGSSSDMKITVGIIDYDNSEFTNILKERLSKHFNISIISENEITNNLNASEIDYAIVIPENFAADIISQKDVKIQGYCLQEKDYSTVINGMVSAFVEPAKEIAKSTNGIEKAFYNAIANIPEPGSITKEKDYSTTWGLVAQFLLMSAVFASTVIINDKENRTFYRSILAPITMKNYMLQSICSFYVITLLQILIVFLSTVFIFHVSYGNSLISMPIMLAVTALVGVSFGIALSSISKNSVQAIAIGVGFIMVMCMLGGAWGGVKPDNQIVLNITKVMPFYWIMDGIQKTLENKSIVEIGSDVFMLLLFTMVFFLFGTWKKTDVIK